MRRPGLAADVELAGMFVSFEGVDGSGKSTQARLLADHVGAAGRGGGPPAGAGGTPPGGAGGPPLGESIRELLLAGEAMAPWAEAALFAAARAELVAEVIGPALDRRAWGVWDRVLDSAR